MDALAASAAGNSTASEGWQASYVDFQTPSADCLPLGTKRSVILAREVQRGLPTSAVTNAQTKADTGTRTVLHNQA